VYDVCRGRRSSRDRIIRVRFRSVGVIRTDSMFNVFYRKTRSFYYNAISLERLLTLIIAFHFCLHGDLECAFRLRGVGFHLYSGRGSPRRFPYNDVIFVFKTSGLHACRCVPFQTMSGTYSALGYFEVFESNTIHTIIWYVLYTVDCFQIVFKIYYYWFCTRRVEDRLVKQSFLRFLRNIPTYGAVVARYVFREGHYVSHRRFLKC